MYRSNMCRRINRDVTVYAVTNVLKAVIVSVIIIGLYVLSAWQF